MGSGGEIDLGKLQAVSISHWEDRYSRDHSSGPGSRGHLARYKASVINELVRRHRVSSILDLGCGDGVVQNLIRCEKYVGLDVAAVAVDLCRRADPLREFFLYDPRSFDASLFQADMTISLDVLYHVAEVSLYNLYLDHLFGSSRSLVVLYATDGRVRRSGQAVFRSDKTFMEDVQERFPGFELLEGYPEENPHFEETGSRFYVYGLNGAR